MGTALITGGSRGMGRTTAFKFAREGHDVAVTYRTRREEADEVVRTIEGLGRRALAAAMDVESQPTIDEGSRRWARASARSITCSPTRESFPGYARSPSRPGKAGNACSA